MKVKNFILAVMVAAMMPSVNVNADSIQVRLSTSIILPQKGEYGGHRTPVRIPAVFIDNYTLYFNTPCDGCELRIVDCTDEVVYSIMIPDNTQRIELPDYLLGTYQLQIIRGNFCFLGDIEL